MGDEEEHRQNMLKKSKEYEGLARINKDNYEQLFIIMSILIGLLLFIFWPENGINALAENPFSVWPVISLLIILLTPLIWLIRINIREATKNHVMEEEYYSRYLIELYMERYFSEHNDRKKLAETYLSHWMISPPSEMIIRLDQKGTKRSDIPQIKLLKELTRLTRGAKTPPNS